MDGARPFSCPAYSRLEEREAEERRERAEEEERVRREAELEEATPRPNNGEARRDTLECTVYSRFSLKGGFFSFGHRTAKLREKWWLPAWRGPRRHW